MIISQHNNISTPNAATEKHMIISQHDNISTPNVATERRTVYLYTPSCKYIVHLYMYFLT